MHVSATLLRAETADSAAVGRNGGPHLRRRTALPCRAWTSPVRDRGKALDPSGHIAPRLVEGGLYSLAVAECCWAVLFPGIYESGDRCWRRGAKSGAVRPDRKYVPAQIYEPLQTGHYEGRRSRGGGEIYIVGCIGLFP